MRSLIHWTGLPLSKGADPTNRTTCRRRRSGSNSSRNQIDKSSVSSHVFVGPPLPFIFSAPSQHTRQLTLMFPTPVRKQPFCSSQKLHWQSTPSHFRNEIYISEGIMIIAAVYCRTLMRRGRNYGNGRMYHNKYFDHSHHSINISIAFIQTFILRQHARIQPHRPQKQIRIVNLALRNLGRQSLRRNNIIQNPLPKTDTVNTTTNKTKDGRGVTHLHS